MYALRDVTIQNADGSVETIDTTDSHPFYVQGQGWVSADDLTAGETLSTPDGQTATVVGTTTVAEPQGVLVYNFTVADDHTYFVEGFGSAPNADGTTSATGSSAAPLDAVWVHNECGGGFKYPNRFNFSEASRGSTAGAATGSSLARNIEEALAIEEARANPTLGEAIRGITMADRRWPASEGWVKMQYVKAVSYGKIIVHYVLNELTAAVDDLKIKVQGTDIPP